MEGEILKERGMGREGWRESLREGERDGDFERERETSLIPKETEASSSLYDIYKSTKYQ